MISSDYSRETAKEAYHKMSLKHHPDKNPLKKDAATKKIQTISNAWSGLDELLGNNDEQRTNYGQPYYIIYMLTGGSRSLRLFQNARVSCRGGAR
jgi:preprotein translocase subunit Sec63